MSVARYALGFGALACIGGSLGLTAVVLRGRLLPSWIGAPARLAESVLGLALLIGMLELLGTVGLFRLLPILVASLLLGAAALRAGGVPGSRGRIRGAAQPPSAASAPVAPAGVQPAERPLLRVVACVVTGLVFAEWAVPTFHSYDVGMRALDSLWYHMPWAASFAQSGHVTSLHFTDVEYLTAFYPASAEVLHGLGIVLFGNDVLSPGLNLVFLGLALLAAWCIGRPRGLASATLAGAALALAAPTMRFSQAGSAANDVVGVFFLLAAVGLLVNATPSATHLGPSPPPNATEARPALALSSPGARAALALAALSAGLAASMKLSLLAPVLALSVGVAVLSPRGRRAPLAATWTGWLALGGGFWYLRNLIAVGNPLPWLSFGFLPVPAAPLQAHTAFSVLHYAADGRIWSRYFAPGLTGGLGALWPLVLALAVLGPLLCVARGPGRTTRVLGLVALAALLAYIVTPESAAGPPGHPSGFAFNLRYMAPALTLALVLVPLATERYGARGRDLTLGALALLLAVTLAESRLWPAGYAAAGLLLGVLVAAPMFLLRKPFEITRRALPLLAGALALLTASAALGYLGAHSYLRGRYVYEPRVSSLATLWQWFRRIHHARVGLVGTFGGFFSYPLDGLDDSNHVAYVAQRGPHGSFTAIRACRQWRTALNSGHYRYLVSTPARDPWHPKRLRRSPEAAWTGTDPHATVVFASVAVGQPVSVYELHGRLNPAGCPAAR